MPERTGVLDEAPFEELARAVDDASAAVAELRGAPRRAAEDLRAAIEAAHRAALVTIVRRLRADEAGRALLFELVDDPMVRMLFSLHGIIRPDPALIPLAAVRRREDTPDELASAGWVNAGPAAAVADGRVTARTVTGPDGRSAPVILVRLGDRLAAFDDECAHQSRPLSGALLDVEAGTLTCPWHGYCYDAGSGECLSAPGAALDQHPLRVIGDDVWLRMST